MKKSDEWWAAWGTRDFPMSDEKAKKFYEKKQEEIKELEALLQEPYTE
jgi:hypothetical protein